MVTLVSAFTLWAALAATSTPITTPRPEPGAVSVPPVLKSESFPWYDATTGRVKPMLSWELRFGWLNSTLDWIGERLMAIVNWFRWLNRWRLPGVAGAGDLLMIGLAMLFLTLVLVVLLEFLRRYRPLAGQDAARRALIQTGSAQRIEGLPAGVRLDAGDPWIEAQKLRERGDYAGAVVYLFAHQLVALDRLKQLRLVPGRTGRQLVRAVADRQLRMLVEPTLRLFEAFYYGHRVPSAEAFEAVWSNALQFQTRLTTGSEAGR